MKTIGKIYLLGLAIALMQGCSDGYRSEAKDSAAEPPVTEQKNKELSEGYTTAESETAVGNSLSANAMSDKKEDLKAADTNKMSFVHSTAARLGKIDSVKKFIRTADIKFKVENVEQSTYKIEDIIARFDGFVTNTNLNCRINYTESHRVKEDSILERKHYVVENYITFRVPKAQLDTTLKQIVGQIDFLDHRIITAEDITFEEIRNKMHQKRFGRYQERITKATNNSSKTNAVVNAEDGLYEKQEVADNSELNDLIRNDKVIYSTVTMYIYQDEKIRDEMVFSQPHVEEYTASFGSEFASSLKFGWTLIEQLFLLLVKLWPVILIGIGLWFGIKRLVLKKA